jgi:prophage antirepressor-like protein
MILGFVAKDISTILEYKDCDQEIREHVDNGYINIYYKKSRPNEMGGLKNKSSLFHIIQCQTKLINESRLYCVILCYVKQVEKNLSTGLKIKQQNY